MTTPLLPGGSALVTLEIDAGLGNAFWVGVDSAPADGVVRECNELDNVDAVTAHCR